MLTDEPAVGAVGSTDAPAAEDSSEDRGWPLSRLLGLATVLVGLGIGLSALADNSFFTHLATGQRIVDGDFPRSDPYTFTGAGEGWVVQSWFASAIYGVLDAVAGPVAIRLFTGVMSATLAGLVWRLSRPADSALVRAGVVAGALVVGATAWSERPLLIGLVLMAVVLLVADGSIGPKVLVPVMWVWVNVHGSYPLALVALAALALGAWLDRRDVRSELDALRWAAIGVVVGGVVNPYGPELLIFPIKLLSRSDILRHITEWQSPTFESFWTRVFLLMVVAAVIGLVRRPTYRDAIPAAIFIAAAMLGARNINVAVLVLVPVIAAGLGDLGSLRVDRRSDPTRLACVALVALMPFVAVTRLADDDYDLSGYPVEAFEWLENRSLVGSETRIAHPDRVGNWLELRYSATLPVFIDDRYELHDRGLFDDYLTLLNGGPQWSEVLDRWDIDQVVWQQNRSLESILRLSEEWDIVYEDDAWFVACRPSGCR